MDPGEHLVIYCCMNGPARPCSLRTQRHSGWNHRCTSTVDYIHCRCPGDSNPYAIFLGPANEERMSASEIEHGLRELEAAGLQPTTSMAGDLSIPEVGRTRPRPSKGR
jgi:hypothetical protein